MGVLEKDETGTVRSCVPYHDATTGAFHTNSLPPLTEPCISPITAPVFNLDDSEARWELLHPGHWENYLPSDEELDVGQDGGEEKPGDYDFEPEWGVVKAPKRGGNSGDDERASAMEQDCPRDCDTCLSVETI
jgi:hypothetical protein